MRIIIVIWLAIALIAAAFLFPPYGYSAYTTYTGVIKAPAAGLSESQSRISWKYVRHQFIFADPPKNDPGLYDKDPNGITYSAYAVTDMGIGWFLVAIETALVVIVASGITATMVYRRKSAALEHSTI